VAACAYNPGSFQKPRGGAAFAGERATAGCLDVAIAPRWSAYTMGQVLEVTFANRCDRAVVVDFPAMRATGRDEQDRERSMSIYDPAGTLRPLTLEARTMGKEVIELRTAVSSDKTHGTCVDIGALARDKERWLCLAAPEPTFAQAVEP
jgi:hypothetical protein